MDWEEIDLELTKEEESEFCTTLGCHINEFNGNYAFIRLSDKAHKVIQHMADRKVLLPKGRSVLSLLKDGYFDSMLNDS